MNLVMTSTPLAVVGCGFSTANAADVVSWHVLAMFAPSFFTGNLIARFGSERVIAAGLALLAAAGAVGLSGVTLGHFSVALILLGLGWNFGFIGATALLTASHTPEERGRVQGMNDFAVIGPRLHRLARLGRADELHRRRPGRRLDRGQPGDGAAARRRRAPRWSGSRWCEDAPCWANSRGHHHRPLNALSASAARATTGAARRGDRPAAACRSSPAACQPASSAGAAAAGTRPRCARARAIAASPSRASAATSAPSGSGSRPRALSSGSAATSAAVPAPRAKSRTTGSAAPSAPRCRAASSIRCPAVWST